jgi:hypothetical protein
MTICVSLNSFGDAIIGKRNQAPNKRNMTSR